MRKAYIYDLRLMAYIWKKLKLVPPGPNEVWWGPQKEGHQRLETASFIGFRPDMAISLHYLPNEDHKQWMLIWIAMM